MNIDERYEALTLTVEVLSGMMKDLLKAHDSKARSSLNKSDFLS